MRKKIRVIGCFIMALAVMFVFLPMNNSYADSNDSRKIVVFKESKGHVDKDKILKKHGAVKVKDIKGTDAVVVRVSSDSSLSKDMGVEYIEDDVIVSISKVKEEGPSKKLKQKIFKKANNLRKLSHGESNMLELRKCGKRIVEKV